ncbi:hypothetical protein DRO30_02095, partial [Candidatus Bathyarchaeota archaeon]
HRPKNAWPPNMSRTRPKSSNSSYRRKLKVCSELKRREEVKKKLSKAKRKHSTNKFDLGVMRMKHLGKPSPINRGGVLFLL